MPNELNLFPCPVCNTGDGGGGNQLCDDCRKEFPFFHGKRCPGCGKSFNGVLAQCPECLSQTQRPWIRALALGDFSGINREMILSLKYGGKLHFARTLGVMAAKLQKEEGDRPDCIVPVPLHFTRLLKRGFNQAELLAKIIGKELDIPVIRALKRVRSIPHQAKLSRLERLKNMRAAFQIKPNTPDLSAKTILLVDDVLTTGATLSAAANALKEAGFHKISVIVAGRGR